MLNEMLEKFGESISYQKMAGFIAGLDPESGIFAEEAVIQKQKKFWDDFADYYANRHPQLPLVQKHWNEIIKLTAVAEEHAVADLACGAGRLLEEIKKRGLNFKSYAGIDYASKMLDQAKRKSGGNGRIRFLESDLGKEIPLPDNSIDRCVSSWGITYLPKTRLQAAMQNVHRIMKPEGAFICASLVKNKKLSSFFRKLAALPEIILKNKWPIVKEAGEFERKIRMLFPLYEEAELEEIISAANLEISKTKHTIAGGSVIFLAKKR